MAINKIFNYDKISYYRKGVLYEKIYPWKI